MSEESDAVIVVVSEETGVVSIAVGGQLIRDLDRKSLYDKLSALIVPGDNEKKNDLLSVILRYRKEKNHE